MTGDRMEGATGSSSRPVVFAWGRQVLRRAVVAVLAVAAVVVVWEAYKWMGQQTDDTWPGTDWGLPVPTDDLTMPHAGDIWDTLWDPVQRGRDQTLASFLVESAWFTWQPKVRMAYFMVVVGRRAGGPREYRST